VLVAHADTYWDALYGDKGLLADVKEIEISDGVVRSVRGGLGADDRAGCAMLWLMRDLGHSLLITNGEEHGRRGAKYLMSKHPEIAYEINSEHQFMIQLDRRNATDFKCYEVGTDDFRAYLTEITGYSEPDRHSYTDICTLCKDICGVHLSIGYYEEHRDDECLILEHWFNTLNLCRSWLSRDDLPRFPLVRKEQSA